jgi:hypothetical protein
MKKLIYTNSDGGLSIIIPASKESLEVVLGPLTDEEYVEHVRLRSIPEDALGVREIDDTDLPSSREFRAAWCDVTPDLNIDIDLVKAKEVQLEKLRIKRNVKLQETDVLMTRALETGVGIEELKVQRQALRDATEPLKALEVSGYNDELVITQILTLGSLNPES